MRRGIFETLKDSNMTEITSRSEVVDLLRLKWVFTSLLDPSFQGAYIGVKQEGKRLAFFVDVKRIDYNILPGILFQTQVQILFLGTNFLYNLVNEIIDETRENGLMETFYKSAKEIGYKPFYFSYAEEGPEVLTLEHLTIGFLACLVPMILAAISFASELYYKYVELDLKALWALIKKRFQQLFRWRNFNPLTTFKFCRRKLRKYFYRRPKPKPKKPKRLKFIRVKPKIKFVHGRV